MTFFIAEICSNHKNNLERSKKLILECKRAGFDAVKFQLFSANKLFTKKVLTKSKSHKNIKRLELSKNLIPRLYNYSKKLKIKFGCTAFDIESCRYLKDYVDFFKIGSYELLRTDLFQECIKSKKKIIFSTGMANKQEILKVIEIFKKKKYYKFSVLRCVSNYPLKSNFSNIKSIQTLKLLLNKKINKHIKVGWSDHSKSKAVILTSILKYGAEIVEIHVDLDGKGDEFKGGHCWLPHEIKKVIEIVNQSNILTGNGKLDYQKSEKNERNWRSDPSDGLRPLKKIRNNLKF